MLVNYVLLFLHSRRHLTIIFQYILTINRFIYVHAQGNVEILLQILL